MDKEKFNGKRLAITVTFVVITAIVASGVTWFVMDLETKNAKIESDAQIAKLQIKLKGMEKETAEMAEEAEGENTYTDISVAEAKAKKDADSDIVVVDVSPFYKDGHIPGAVNYPVSAGELDKAIPTLDKTKAYIVYCHVDSVAISGAQKLVDAGMTKVYRIIGNYQAWVDAGYDIEK
jgi:rhodanese-related sulfurtransferase